jgi:hypothetical protein
MIHFTLFTQGFRRERVWIFSFEHGVGRDTVLLGAGAVNEPLLTTTFCEQ